MRRRFPVGAEPDGEGVHFRVWAPGRRTVEAVFEDGKRLALEPERGGYFSGFRPGTRPGALYRLSPDGEGPFPDPASRFQPDGPHGPSAVVDSGSFRWSDAGWKGLAIEGQVLYELHVGTFTPEGTWRAAARELRRLAGLGVTSIEVLPVADFPGRFGWGYDGVDLFAPTRLYGSPNDFRAFVDAAHGQGLGVLLDVVYNHIGPDGNYLGRFSDAYFAPGRATGWGDSFNFDGPGSGPVREFVLSNATYWVSEFHLDGLRLDATDAIRDGSREHIVAELARAARRAGAGRGVLVIAENDDQDARLVRPAGGGGLGLDAVWNDDFHHAAFVALTGRREAFRVDFLGTPQELLSAVKRGYLFQGQLHLGRGVPRGASSAGIAAAAFVHYLENHDQVAHSLRGPRRRQETSPGRFRAMTALLLLAPQTPLLFQGQEFGSEAPFLFFADHGKETARATRRGRREFLARFRSLSGADVDPYFRDPSAPETFRLCKLERAADNPWTSLHRDLLGLRREDPVFRAQRGDRLDGAVLGPEALVLRFFGEGGDDRLLLLNLGRDLELSPCPEPLLAPPAGCRWRLRWSSESPEYGGGGAYPPVDEAGGWRLAGHATSVLAPRAR